MSKSETVRAITVCVDYSDVLSILLPNNLRHFDDYCVVTSPDDKQTQELAESHNIVCHVTDAFYQNGATFNKWKALEEGLDLFCRRPEREGWIWNLDADILLPASLPDRYWFIPGYLYTPLRRMYPRLPENISEIGVEYDWSKYPLHGNQNEWAGYCQIFHTEDPCCQQVPWFEQNWKHAGGGDSMFQKRWDQQKKIRPPFEVLHVGPAGTNWMGRTTAYLDGTLPAQAEQRRSAMDNLFRQRKLTRGQRDRYQSEKIGEGA